MDQTTIEEISLKNKEPHWMLEKRLAAFKSFQALPPLQLYKYGIGIFFDMRSVDLEKVYNENSSFFVKTDEHSDVEVMSLAAALKKIPEEIKKYLFSTAEFSESDKTSLLHASIMNNVLVIRIPEKKQAGLFHIKTLIEKGSLAQHILIIAKKNSSIHIIDQSNSKEETWHSKHVELIAEENSNVQYTDIQQLSLQGTGFSKKTSEIKENAQVHISECALGSRVYRSEIQNLLLGKGAQGTIKAIFLGNKNQAFDLKADSYHRHSDTASNILVKGALLGNAKTICRGLVKIQPNAQRCDGYQKLDTLLLSKDAEINTVPNLEIDNNEVKCSHGASIGQLNEEDVFYLMSRGLTKKQATQIIISGFFESVLESIQDASIKEGIMNSIEATIAEGGEV